MKWFVFLFLLLLCGCDKHSIKYTVHGTVLDSSFNGEYVYIFPFNNNDLSKLDSVLIVEGSFIYHGFTDSTYIMVVSAQNPISRFELEDMLFITQTGDINIQLNSSSTVDGTPLNDTIQKWKTGKESYRSKLMEVAASSDEKPNLQKNLIRDEVIKFHYQMALNNIENPFGQFIVSMMSDLFSKEQLHELGH